MIPVVSVWEAKGISYGDGFLTDPDFVRISKMCDNIHLPSGDFNNGQIRRWIPSHKSRWDLSAVSHGYCNFLGFGDHMVIRQNMTLFIDNKTRSLSFPRCDLKPKIHAECRRCDVHNCRMGLFKDADVDLFIG